MPAKIKIISASCRNRDAHTGPVDVRDGLNGGIAQDQVSRLDLDVGWREFDMLGARRFSTDQADIPDLLRDRIGQFPRRLER